MPGGYEPAGNIPDSQFWSIGSHDIHHVERPGLSVPTNVAYVAGVAVYVPFVLQVPATVYEWWWVNGTLTTAHNHNFGIYREDFTAVQRLGSTAGLTTASVLLNTTTWTDLALRPGSYYMAYLNDSTRNLFMSTDAVNLYQAAGLCEQTGLGSTLPDPMVPVAYTRAFCPNFGMNLSSVAL